MFILIIHHSTVVANSAATNTSVLNFASYIITQHALTDAPERYSTFIQQGIDYANNQPLSIPPKCDSHCCSKFEVTINNKKPKFSLFEPNGILLTITELGFSVWTKWNVHIDLTVFIREGDYMAWPLYDCWWTWTLCRSTPGKVTGNIAASIAVTVSWNKVSQNLTIIPNPPTLTPSLHFTTDCDTADFLNDIVDVYGAIDQKMNEAVTNAVKSLANKLLYRVNVPQTFEAYSGVRITYYVTDLTFTANQWATISAMGHLEAQDPSTGTWLTYVDSIGDANMAPSTDWPWSTRIDRDDDKLWLLNGLRVSSSLLTALIWAADTIGELTPVYNFTALDATLIFNLTWSKPLLSIPRDTVLQAIMGYGIVNGTCYQTSLGPSHHNDTVILSFYFTNLMGSATVGLEQYGSNVSLSIQIVDFNVSELHPVLTKPKLPLPGNVIANMMAVLVNSSIPLINAYLMDHAMLIPSGFSQWIPHPQLTLIHQEGCCDGHHGYMQFYSLCSCNEGNPLWTKCSNLPCVPTPTPTSPPSTTTTPVTPPNTGRRLATDNYAIWMNVYTSISQDTSSCDVTKTDDIAWITLLQNTNGKCMALSPYLSEAVRYYSLLMSVSDTINDIRLLCNAQCTACKWPAVDHEEITIGNCYPFTYTSTIMLLESKETCIGGNVVKSQIHNNKNVVVMTYNGSSMCEAEQSNTVMIKNLGDILSQCVQSTNDPNQYITLGQFQINNTVFYNLGLNCTNVQAPCDKCNQPLYTKIEYDTCFASNQPNSSMKFIFAKDTAICGNTSSVHTKWSTQSIWIAVLVSIIIILVCVMLSCAIYTKRVLIKTKCGALKELCVTRCHRPHIDCTPVKRCCYAVFVGSFISLKDWILNGIDSPKNIYNIMTKRQKLHNWLLLIASILILIEMIAWLSESPWSIFYRESFDEIGIPSDVLDITNLEAILDGWESFAEYFFGIFGFGIILLLVIRFICKRKILCWEWYQFRVLLLLLYILIVFMGIFLFIPTFFQFSKMVRLNEKNENTFTASSDIEDTVNEMIGYSFVGVFLSYFSNVLLYWMYTIPAGVYLASLFFIYFLFEDDDDNVAQIMDNNNNNHGDKRKLCFCCCFMEFECNMEWRCTNRVYVILKDIFKYKVSKDLKATMIARIIVIVFLLQAMATCIESLPVIIMYQSFGNNFVWLFAWILWWTLPICLLAHLWWSCNQYIKQLRGESQFNAIRSQKHLILNAIMEVIIFLTVLVTTIVTESKKTQIAIWFLILTCCAALMISGILWAFILHYMFENTKGSGCYKKRSLTELTINSKKSTDVEEEKYYQLNDSASNTSTITLEKNHHSAGYVCFWLKWCLCETREIQNPHKFGERVLYRRIFLWIGVPSFGYVVIKNFVDIMGISVKQTVIDFFTNLNMGVTWPDNDEGGTLFDSTFAVYNNARTWSASCSLIAFFLLLLALLSDCFMMEKRGLKVSRIFGWFTILALLASTFSPSVPNYLSHTPIDSICPYCAPQFTNAIYLLFGDIVGLFCSGLFTINMLPILVLAVIPAIARASCMVLDSYKIYKLDLNEQDTVRYIFICGSFLGPFTTFAPLLVYQQVMGDIVVSILLFVFWMLPIFIAININAKNCVMIYYGYIGTYYILLIAIFIYHIGVYGIPHWLQVLIHSTHWWIETILEIVGEWCLTNVILSDFLYAILMGLRIKHYQQQKGNDDEQQNQQILLS